MVKNIESQDQQENLQDKQAPFLSYSHQNGVFNKNVFHDTKEEKVKSKLKTQKAKLRKCKVSKAREKHRWTFLSVTSQASRKKVR